MTMSPADRQLRRRRSSRPRVVVWLALFAGAAVLFGAGVAVGEALHDNPTPGITQTSERTVHP